MNYVIVMVGTNPKLKRNSAIYVEVRTEIINVV
jgi:hypothetical protein